MAAILVAAGKTKQQVFDSIEAGLLEIRGLARTDALQELQGHLQHILGHRLLVEDEAALFDVDALDVGGQLEGVVDR